MTVNPKFVRKPNILPISILEKECHFDRNYMHSDGWKTKFCRLDFTFLIFVLKDFFVPVKNPTFHICPFCRMSISRARYIFRVCYCSKNPIILGRGFPFLSSITIWKYFLSISLIFSALNQFQQLERNADVWCKDEGVGKRLKNDTGERKPSTWREGGKGRRPKAERKRDRCAHTLDT